MHDSPAAQDARLFAEVWGRVMPEGGPILLEGTTEQPSALTPSPALLPTLPHSAPPLTTADEETTAFLRRRIEAELKNAQSCRSLQTQWSGSSLKDLSQRGTQRAKRLSAALLLLTGVWYLPAGQCTPRSWPDRRSALRGLFHTFQADGMLYGTAAASATDALLSELFEELSGDALQMRDAVRRILEQG